MRPHYAPPHYAHARLHRLLPSRHLFEERWANVAPALVPGERCPRERQELRVRDGFVGGEPGPFGHWLSQWHPWAPREGERVTGRRQVNGWRDREEPALKHRSQWPCCLHLWLHIIHVCTCDQCVHTIHHVHTLSRLIPNVGMKCILFNKHCL